MQTDQSLFRKKLTASREEMLEMARRLTRKQRRVDSLRVLPPEPVPGPLDYRGREVRLAIQKDLHHLFLPQTNSQDSKNKVDEGIRGPVLPVLHSAAAVHPGLRRLRPPPDLPPQAFQEFPHHELRGRLRAGSTGDLHRERQARQRAGHLPVLRTLPVLGQHHQEKPKNHIREIRGPT